MTTGSYFEVWAILCMLHGGDDRLLPRQLRRVRVLQPTSWQSTTSRLSSSAVDNHRRVSINHTKISYTMQQPEGDNTVIMQRKFIEHTQINPAMEQMFHAMSTMMMQVNHMNQTPIVHGLQIHPHAQRPANRRIQESTQDPSRAFLQKMF